LATENCGRSTAFDHFRRARTTALAGASVQPGHDEQASIGGAPWRTMKLAEPHRVLAGLVPATHDFVQAAGKSWMAVTSTAKTKGR